MLCVQGIREFVRTQTFGETILGETWKLDEERDLIYKNGTYIFCITKLRAFFNGDSVQSTVCSRKREGAFFLWRCDEC